MATQVGTNAVVVYGAAADMLSPAGVPLGSLFVVDSGVGKGLEYSVGEDGEWFARGQIKLDQSGDPAANVVLRETIAGETNNGTSNEYLKVREHSNATVLDGTSAVSVAAGADATLDGILIITSGTTATIVGLTDQAGAAKTVILTSSAASQYFDMHNIKVGSTFTVTPSVDDDVVVFWSAR